MRRGALSRQGVYSSEYGSVVLLTVWTIHLSAHVQLSGEPRFRDSHGHNGRCVCKVELISAVVFFTSSFRLYYYLTTFQPRNRTLEFFITLLHFGNFTYWIHYEVIINRMVIRVS